MIIPSGMKKRCRACFLTSTSNGSLAAIVYSLRVLVLMERRIASIEGHIERLIEKIMREEIVIEKEVHGLKKKR